MAKTHPNQMVARDYRKLVDAARKDGWALTISSRGHPKLTSPDGSYATPIPGSSGGGHSRLLRTITLRLRRHGVDV